MKFLFDIDPLRVEAKLSEIVVQLNKWRLRIQHVGRLLDANPLLNGVHIKNIEFDTAPGSHDVNHKLGRVPQGWFVTRQHTLSPFLGNDETIWEVKKDSRTITFHTTTACWVDMWFF